MKKTLTLFYICLIISIFPSCSVFKMNKKQAQIQTQAAEIQALKAQLNAKDSLLTQLTIKTDEMEQKVAMTLQVLQNANGSLSAADASFEDVGGESGTDEWGFLDGGATTHAWTDKIEAPQKVQEKGNFDSTKININSEKYGEIIENEFITTTQTPTSTFSIDADGASYSNLKRYVLEEEVLKTPQLPPKNAIRLEEMINYFSYDYPNPTDGKPIFVDGEVSDCPWNQEHKLVRIGFKGKTYEKRERPSSNLVLLIDVSGSMSSYLPLVKQSFELLVNELSPNDKVAIVVYAGVERLELPSTSISNKELILQHLRDLEEDGSTNGAQGIITAYDIATQNFIPNANNRIILATDGDFNVGISNREDLIKLIEKQRASGVFLSVIGCGTDNYNDEGLEALADHGNGIFEYLNTIQDAQKIFVQEFDKFFTVAKDVKIQIDFNPQMVASYRLIGYENRLLNKEDFANDTKAAGDLSAGQSLTALYEILPAKRSAAGKKKSIRSLQINFRYKEPNEGKSELISIDVVDNDTRFEDASENLRFAATVSSLGMLLRESKFKGTASLPQLKDWAENTRTYDANGHRKEFLHLLDVIETIKK